jgi:cellulose synthase/poly-beta-1,6-N-acetylglucosamine synthase-like glycosyltransferase
MKVSIIIAVYKNVQALNLIIEALKLQTYKNFEVVVVEDCQDENMSQYINSIKELEIKHTTQEDIGLRKARSQNNGIIASTGEYLIFIDGDCIPYTTFIENHVKLAEKNVVLSGRRVNLNEKVTTKIFNNQTTPQNIEKNYLFQTDLMFDKSVKYEQGIYCNPEGYIYKKFLQNNKRNVSILGCNFSCFKSDFVAINGFDEGYGGTALSDDTDLTWRFQAYGAKLKSCKNAANIFHLWHKVVDRGSHEEETKLMYENKKRNKFICTDGLNTH